MRQQERFAEQSRAFNAARKQQERKYRVKGSWIFNLESMSDHIWCIIYDAEEGKIRFPISVAGKLIKDEDGLYELKDECFELEWAAKSRKVTGREYGRIKAIVEYRVMARYTRCLNSGMSESMAGECFADM